MRLKLIYTVSMSLCIGLLSHAQLLEKLKQRAEEKGLETRAVSYDSTAYDPDDYAYEEEVEIKSASDFFTMDVVMALYDEDGNWIQTSYFDKETIAMRTEKTALGDKHIYHDRKGKFYAFDETEGQYKTMALLPASSMGMMTAGMTTQAYKLPPEPYLNAFGALADLDIALNFLILEMTFVYKPIHFEDNEEYTKRTFPCNAGTCTLFNYTDPQYKGSYILFNEDDRISEISIKSTNSNFSNNERNQSGKFVFKYEPVDVTLPDAVEQSIVPGPLGKILPLEKGLEPWKHNKADKQKNN